MKIPRTIKIGAQRIKVVVVPSVVMDDEEVLGISKSVIGRIEVASRFEGYEVPEDSMADTFLHEVIHATSCTYGCDLTENQVNGLAGGLLQVIRDNNLDFRKVVVMAKKKKGGKKKGCK
jgi:hypothetical protein